MHPIHPMLVHFPIALLSAAVFFDLLGGKWRPEDCRIASLYTLVLGFAGAGVSVVSGGMAEDAAERSGVPEQAMPTKAGPFEILSWATRNTVDMEGEVVMPDGADTSYFSKNRTLFVDHEYDIMRAVGKDPMRTKSSAPVDSYWIKRDPPGPKPESLSDQF